MSCQNGNIVAPPLYGGDVGSLVAYTGGVISSTAHSGGVISSSVNTGSVTSSGNYIGSIVGVCTLGGTAAPAQPPVWGTVTLPQIEVDQGYGSLNLSQFILSGTLPIEYLVHDLGPTGVLPDGISLLLTGSFTGTATTASTGNTVFEASNAAASQVLSDPAAWTVIDNTPSPPVWDPVILPTVGIGEGYGALNLNDFITYTGGDAIGFSDDGTLAAGIDLRPGGNFIGTATTVSTGSTVFTAVANGGESDSDPADWVVNAGGWATEDGFDWLTESGDKWILE